jgi:hypothetical protein
MIQPLEFVVFDKIRQHFRRYTPETDGLNDIQGKFIKWEDEPLGIGIVERTNDGIPFRCYFGKKNSNG